MDAGGASPSQFVVQKYIETPLIVADRKFDLRQWVLVTSWSPLEIFFYDECYARFSVEQYSNKEEDLENKFIHLVNNSIGKQSDQFGQVHTAENGESIEVRL